MQRRVVITGLGVVAPNANSTPEFLVALREGRSGLRFNADMEALGFACQVAAIPEGLEKRMEEIPANLRVATNECMSYAALSAMEAFRDAGLEPAPGDQPHEDTGAIIGTGIGGIDTFANRVYPNVHDHRIKRLGSTVVEQIMGSGAAARIAGILGLGNQVFSNSSACNTGTEALIMGAQRIMLGLADRMLVGGTEGSDPHTWAPFDSMKVLSRKFNDNPEGASRPMSETAAGFVPAAGAAVLVLEDLDTALARGARIYAEVIGSATNCGGMRAGGTMTMPSPQGVQKCIRQAVLDAKIDPKEIDYINGHLTATIADPMELNNWASALGREAGDFPWINSTKSLIGHSLGAAGAIEAVATILQLHYGFIHTSRNCEDFHPEIANFAQHVPSSTRDLPLKIAAKASFGFGDVNSCVIFKKWSV
ncbi:MAG: beta-ketoacyl-[acyl-carrier-protein] synthase family protein [Proteobacteria bacterium]|nr:MAG: beta-ketoacyl-[acyl-carrier-protein] synthase family protein [Pseudomonadota bacterium]